MSSRKTPFERAMTLAALSGFKVALGPAFLAASRNGPNRGAWAIAAMGEMFLDKVGIFPPRFRPSLLIPHALAGAWVARESMKEEGQERSYGPGRRRRGGRWSRLRGPCDADRAQQGPGNLRCSSRRG